MSKEINEILDKYENMRKVARLAKTAKEDLEKNGYELNENAPREIAAQAISDLLKEQKQQLLRKVEESVMGAVMIGDIFNSDLFTGYQIILFDGNTEVLRTPIRDKDIPLTEIRPLIIKSIKELGEEL